MIDKKIVFFPGLNGIRALAAIGVMLSHIALSFKNTDVGFYLFGSKDGKPKSWVLGEHGVTMFFVLSGFLITYLLLKERHTSGKIHIASFYKRRILRIWPLYYLYLFVVLLYLYIVGAPANITSSGPYFYLFFLANIPFILEKAIPSLAHLWSIAVEEQFYIFWPLFFKISNQLLLKIILVFIVVLSITRVVLWYYMPFSVPALLSVVNRFDCMLIGASGAVLYYKKSSAFLKVVDNKLTQFIALGILFLMLINRFVFFNSIIEVFVVELLTLAIIIGQINVKNRLVNFNNRTMDYIGKLSYGIYIIHVLILHLVSEYIDWSVIENEIFKIFAIYFTVIVLTLFLAHISYNFFELRFLRLKNKYAYVKSASSNTFDIFKK
ncbi:acyltransferase family protein [Chryseobacterium sp. R2A-55]|uniref:acyltransferase family protein n=1 Tax=Chryseobacterium sp. R2A-55 TaxID=2744445 RepID=UPI001F19E64D|nr:acyltransferase [Chryseobacterium sp. R2A-55]